MEAIEMFGRKKTKENFKPRLLSIQLKTKLKIVKT